MKKQTMTQKVSYLLFLGIGAKFLVDTSLQIYNPFLTIIAAGIGISAVSMGGLVALRSLMGLIAPVIGMVADRIGHRKVMQLSLLSGGIGMLMIGLSSQVPVFTAGIILTGFGQAGFTPNLHAYLSSRLPYKRRARGIGMVEYAWALAGIVGLFLAGFLIESFSWRSPFILLGGLLLTAVLFFSTLPDDQSSKKQNDPERGLKKRKPNLLKRVQGFMDLGPHASSAWGTILLQGFSMFSIMHVMIIHGGWLEGEYGLTPSSLGLVALIFGLVDLSASITVSVAVDRIGKKKSVLIGITGMTVGLGLMPFLNFGLYPAIAGLLIPRLFFEFALVSNLALISEQVPGQRGKVLSLSTTSGLLGMTAASTLGPFSYYTFGVPGLALVSAAAGVACFVLLLMVIHENGAEVSGL